MPGAETLRKSLANQSSEASSSTPRRMTLKQPHTSQQGVSARTTLHGTDAQKSGSKSQNTAEPDPEKALEEHLRMIVIATYDFSKSAVGDWRQEFTSTTSPSTSHLQIAMALAKAMKVWREAKPTNPNDMIQFLKGCAQDKQCRRMFFDIENPSIGDEDGLTVQLMLPEDDFSVSVEAEGGLNVPALELDDAAASLNTVEMEGLTFDKALTIVTKHEALLIAKADDDVAKIKTQSKRWIPIIMQMFDKNYCTKPTFAEFGELLSEFGPWQKTHLDKTRARLHSNPQLHEAHAVVLFNTVILLHETRVLRLCSSRDDHGMDKWAKCSERLKLVIAAIEKSAIVSWDIVNGQ